MLLIFKISVLIVLTGDIVFPFLIAIPYKGYSHKDTVMSVLGSKKSPLRYIYNTWTIISGCIFIFFGYVVYQYFGQSQKGLSIAIWVLFALYGLGCEIISGIFPVDEDASVKNLSSVVHGIGSVIGFTALVFAPLLFGIAQFGTAENIIGTISIVSFALCFAAFIIFVMGDKPKFQNSVFSLTGLWQRISMYAMYLPFIVFIINSIVI